MVQYVYDAWGQNLVLDGTGNVITSSSHIGQLNPFRYRGYFYDGETGVVEPEQNPNEPEKPSYYVEHGYINRFDCLDHVKATLQTDTYGLNEWLYYSEYNLHMYGWFLSSVFTSVATSTYYAKIDKEKRDERTEVFLGTIFLGMLGL